MSFSLKSSYNYYNFSRTEKLDHSGSWLVLLAVFVRRTGADLMQIIRSQYLQKYIASVIVQRLETHLPA